MNKKRFGLLLPVALAAFLGFNACRETDTSFDTPEIALDSTTLHVDKAAGYTEIYVESNRTWTASTTASDWISITPSSGSNGKTKVKISYLANDSDGAVERSAEIIFAIGKTASEKLTVYQSGSIQRTGLFVMTFGTSATSATPYPLFADYTDWGASGEGFIADSTKVTGSGSVRQPTSRLSSGYQGASAGSHAYLSNTQNIIISKIDTKGNNLFDLTWGVSAYDGSSNNTFTIGQIDAFVSPDGVNWTPVSYSYTPTPEGIATWGICQATTGIPQGSQRLYIKIAANANAGWQMRVDDITVLSRGSGALNEPTVTTGSASSITASTAILAGTYTAPDGVTVSETGFAIKPAGGNYTLKASALAAATFSLNLDSLTAGKTYYYKAYAKVGSTVYYGSEMNFTTSSLAVYAENMGATNVSGTTLISAHTGWQKGGSGGANVTYEGTADIRTTGAYTAGSGGNNVFFGTLPRTFVVKNIDISSKTNFILTFAMSHFSGTTVKSDMKVEASLDGGTSWDTISYTLTSGTDWQTATGEFRVPTSSTTLALRYSANIASSMRIDDIALNEGGNGPLLNPITPPTVIDTLRTIAQVRAMKTNLEGKGTPTTTSGQEYTIGGTKIVGRVVSKYDGTQTNYGNLNNKSIAIQDNSTAGSGICIRVANAASNTFALGDEVQVILTGGKMSYYSGQLQVLLADDANITKTASANSPLAATNITYSDLITGNYESMYVAIPNVEATIAFANGIKTMYQADYAGNVIMENTNNDNFVMYTSSKAPFQSTVIPTGSGTLKGLGGIYVSTSTVYQIQPQVESDFNGLTGTRFGSSGTLTFGTPYVKGSLSVGASSTAKVMIPYTYATANNVTVSVAISGTTGLLPINNQAMTLGTGADTLELPIQGTPASEGPVTFKISGITLPVDSCTATVAPSGTGTETILYQSGFESSDSFTAGTTYNNATVAFTGASGKQWGTYYGTPSTTSPLVGSQSMQMRWYTTAPDNKAYTYTSFALNKVTKVTFKAANTAGINVIVSYSTNGGTTWTNPQTYTLSTAANDYTYSLNTSGVDSVQVRFEITYSTAPTATSRLYLDDVKIYGYE